MSKFAYQAINENGTALSGVIEADSLETANGLLVEKGYIPSKVTKHLEGARSSVWSDIQDRLTPIKPPELVLFTKQFRSMLRAGVPMLSILQVLEEQTENRKLKKILGNMTLNIKQGGTLHDTFRKYPAAFSPLYCSLLRAGEISGSLPRVLDRLVYIMEHEHKVKSDIRSALQYPIIVVIFLTVAFFVLLTFAIPKFVNIFLNAGIALPLPTQICMILYTFLFDYWFVNAVAAAAGIIGLIYYLRTENGKYVRDVFFLRLPVFGPLFIKTAMSRFASIFSILHSSGVTVLDSLTVLSGSTGNLAVAKEFRRIRDQVEEGAGISSSLRSARYFTPMVVNMVAIGEKSAQLAEMLSEVATHYDDEVEYAMKRLTDALTPALTVGLAAVVGFFALAIFLPMWDLTKMLR